MKITFLLSAFVLFLSTAAHATDLDTVNTTGLVKPTEQVIAATGDQPAETVSPATAEEKASLKLIDELTEKVYLQRRKLWQHEVGVLTSNQ